MGFEDRPKQLREMVSRSSSELLPPVKKPNSFAFTWFRLKMNALPLCQKKCVPKYGEKMGTETSSLVPVGVGLRFPLAVKRVEALSILASSVKVCFAIQCMTSSYNLSWLLIVTVGVSHAWQKAKADLEIYLREPTKPKRMKHAVTMRVMSKPKEVMRVRRINPKPGKKDSNKVEGMSSGLLPFSGFSGMAGKSILSGIN